MLILKNQDVDLKISTIIWIYRVNAAILFLLILEIPVTLCNFTVTTISLEVSWRELSNLVLIIGNIGFSLKEVPLNPSKCSFNIGNLKLKLLKISVIVDLGRPVVTMVTASMVSYYRKQQVYLFTAQPNKFALQHSVKGIVWVF